MSNSRTSYIMFKVGGMYVESVSRVEVKLTSYEERAFKIDDNVECVDFVISKFNQISTHGLDVNIIRRTVETKEYIDDVKIVTYGAKLKLAMERREG